MIVFRLYGAATGAVGIDAFPISLVRFTDSRPGCPAPIDLGGVDEPARHPRQVERRGLAGGEPHCIARP